MKKIFVISTIVLSGLFVVRISMGGTHTIEACTHLTGDECVINDCKTKVIETTPDTMLYIPQYTNGCSFSDGFTDFALEEIQKFSSGCEDNMGYPGWNQYLELGPASLFAGGIHFITMVKNF